MAVASPVPRLIGLVALHPVLGPIAIALALIALRRGTPRPSGPGSGRPWASPAVCASPPPS